MARFINKQNGRIVELLSTNEKFKTVCVKFEDDGTTRDFSSSTWKRWWKELPETDEELVQEVMQQKKDLGIEVPSINPEKVEIVEEVAGDGTPYSQVLQEIQHDEKLATEKKQTKKNKSSKKAQIKKRVQNEEVPDILAYIDEYANTLGMEFYIRDKQPNLINYKKETSKVIFMLRKTYDKVELFVKSKTLDKKLDKKLEAVNGFYDRKLAIETLNDNTKQLINSIIDSYKEV